MTSSSKIRSIVYQTSELNFNELHIALLLLKKVIFNILDLHVNPRWLQSSLNIASDGNRLDKQERRLIHTQLVILLSNLAANLIQN